MFFFGFGQKTARRAKKRPTSRLGFCRKRQVPFVSTPNDRNSMNTKPASILHSSHVALRLGICAAALVGTAAMTSNAHAVVVTFNTPISVPNTFAGVYINLLTGANAVSTAAVPGWDFGPWGSSSTLSFFFPATPANSSGAVAGSATGPYLSLPLGSVISAASTFAVSASNLQTTAFQTTGSRFLGFRFFNESTAAINYGYLTMNTTGPLGFPATITSWSFENNGGSITVVPEPSTYAMMGLGLAGLLFAVRRRKQA